MTQKQLALHKKMLGLVKGTAEKAAKMKEILDLQRKANEIKKGIISFRADLDAVIKEEGDRVREINADSSPLSRMRKMTLDKRSSTLIISGFPLGTAEALVRKHLGAAPVGEEEIAGAGISSIEMQDSGTTALVSFISRAAAEKAKRGAGIAIYEGTGLSLSWQQGTLPPAPSGEGAGRDALASDSADRVKVTTTSSGSGGGVDADQDQRAGGVDEDQDQHDEDTGRVIGNGAGPKLIDKFDGVKDGANDKPTDEPDDEPKDDEPDAFDHIDDDEQMVNYDFDDDDDGDEEDRWR